MVNFSQSWVAPDCSVYGSHPVRVWGTGKLFPFADWLPVYVKVCLVSIIIWKVQYITYTKLLLSISVGDMA